MTAQSPRILLLAPAYLGSVARYALMAAFDKVVVDGTMRYDKRAKETHRCKITDTHGPRQLTVPIEKPVSLTGAKWDDITVSAHGGWWHVHWETLRSAYGRTPYFEYYADDFMPLFTSASAGMKLVEFDEKLDTIVRRLLLMDSDVTYGVASDNREYVFDCRRGLPSDMPELPAYWQVRGDSHGFEAGMSVVDLLFNLGPEAALYLDAAAERICLKLNQSIK